MLIKVLVRLFYMSLVLLTVVSLIFVLVHLAGDPADALVPPGSSPADVATFEEKYGLDDGLPQQYVRYLQRALQGDFGDSWRSGRPAMEMVLERLPVTLRLVGGALLLALVFSVPLGAVAGSSGGTWLRWLANGLALAGQAVPAFWLGTILILVFSVRLDMVPASGRSGALSYVLPIVALAAYPAAVFVRLMRESVADVASLDYVRTARAKGLPQSSIVRSHILRNAALPIIAFTGVTAGFLIAGAIAIEAVFAFPGMGLLALQSVSSRDLPVIQAFAIVSAVLIVISNQLSDVVSWLVDPRLRPGQGRRT